MTGRKKRKRIAAQVRKECGDKTQHATKAKAELAIKRSWIRFHIRLGCYRCYWCGGWHLTRKTKGYKP